MNGAEARTQDEEGEEDEDDEDEEEEGVYVAGELVPLSEVTDQHEERMSKEEYEAYRAVAG